MTDTHTLNAILASEKAPRVVIIGDLILDRYVAGEVTRISPEAPIPVLAARSSELRLGGTYLFRDVMLMTVEWRAPREVPEYYESQYTINLGSEVWFYDAFALRAGMNRDRITAGLGMRTKHVQIDVALMSERRIGSLYRLSAIFLW